MVSTPIDPSSCAPNLNPLVIAIAKLRGQAAVGGLSASDGLDGSVTTRRVSVVALQRDPGMTIVA